MLLGIISAMDSEHRQLAERLQEKKVVTDGRFHYVEGMLGGNRLVLTQCGIGKANAAVGAAELIRRYSPDCVVSTGVAGGIDPCLKVTDVVVSRQIVYHDVWCGDGNEYGQVQGFPAVFQGYAPLLEHALSLNGKPDWKAAYTEGLSAPATNLLPIALSWMPSNGAFLRDLPWIWSLPLSLRPATCMPSLSSVSVS